MKRRRSRRMRTGSYAKEKNSTGAQLIEDPRSQKGARGGIKKKNNIRVKKVIAPHEGLEPSTSGLEVSFPGPVGQQPTLYPIELAGHSYLPASLEKGF